MYDLPFLCCFCFVCTGLDADFVVNADLITSFLCDSCMLLGLGFFHGKIIFVEKVKKL